MNHKTLLRKFTLGSGALKLKYIDQASPCFPKKNYKPKNSLYYSWVCFWPWFPSSPYSLMTKHSVDVTVWPTVMEGSGDQTKPVTAVQIALSKFMEGGVHGGDTMLLLWFQSFFVLSLGEEQSFKIYWFISYIEFVLFCKWQKQQQKSCLRGKLTQGKSLDWWCFMAEFTSIKRFFP